MPHFWARRFRAEAVRDLLPACGVLARRTEVEISGLMPGAVLEAFENGRDLSSPDPFETLEAAGVESIAWLTEQG